jgi:hypothetical protein
MKMLYLCASGQYVRHFAEELACLCCVTEASMRRGVSQIHPLGKRDYMSVDGEQTAKVFIPIEQEAIPFYGHELVAVQLGDGRIAAVLRWICEGLHLNQQSQMRSIRGRRALAQGLVEVSVQTEGGRQAMPALTLQVLPGWLFSIDERRVREEARDDLVRFQLECVDVLAEYFVRKHQPALPMVADSAAVAVAAQITELSGVVNLLREHLEGLLAVPDQVRGLTEQMGHVAAIVEVLAERQDAAETHIAKIDERTQRLTTAHARTVQEQVDRLVRETSYLPIPLTYAIVYGRLKHRFRASSYREIPDERFDEVLAYLRDEFRQATDGEAPEQGSLF